MIYKYLVHKEQFGKALSQRLLYFWQAAQARAAFCLDGADISLASDDSNLEPIPIHGAGQ